MRFALLGNHSDGLAIARALVATGRHDLVAVQDSSAPEFALGAAIVADLEEILADPAIALVIVAGAESIRAEQLRRALQSERHVLCVHPFAKKPELAYQAAVIQAETKVLLLPLMPDSLHPAFTRLTELAKKKMQLLRLDRRGIESLCWDMLRRVGGEIVELVGFASAEEWTQAEPLLLNGKFEKGGLFQVTVLPGVEQRQELSLLGAEIEAELTGPASDGGAQLCWRMKNGDWQEEAWNTWDRWAAMATLVDDALENPTNEIRISWQDEVRYLELDDALLRSVEKRRASSLDLAEFTEDSGPKGTLTLIGCGMIWLLLLIFALSIWLPWIRWAIVPLLVGFLALLALKWLGSSRPTAPTK